MKLLLLLAAATRPVTPDDLKLPVKASHVGTELIMDGRVLGENLARIGQSEAWLIAQLRAAGYESATQIFLGVYHAERDELSLFPPH